MPDAPPPDVFVGVPAYNTGEKLLATLQSLMDQHFTSINVLVAVEPTPEAARTLEIANHYASLDNRFSVQTNREVLGWAGNIREVMRRAMIAGSRYFMVLPHDDALHPDCIGKLHATFQHHPDAAITFPDIYFIGAADGLQACPSRSGNTSARLLGHFADGGNPEFWKGLTRTDLLADDFLFPAYGNKSFAAEYEWAAMLVSAGNTVREPAALYYKRIHAADGDSVSTEWLHKDSLETMQHSLAGHRKRMLALIERRHLTDDDHHHVTAAFEASHLWRTQEMTQDRVRLTADERSRSDSLRATLPPASPVHHRLDLCDVRNRCHDQPADGLVAHARAITDAAPDDHDARILLMKLLLRTGHHHQAVYEMNELESRFPNSWRHRELSGWLAKNLINHYDNN